ncbi:MAG: zinc ribbon domain-containing protein [Bacteroidota bacterium]
MVLKSEVRCPKHGAVKRTGATHCPDCGERLVRTKLFWSLIDSLLPSVVIPVLVAALILGLIWGLIWVLDVPGCIEREEARKAQEQEEWGAKKNQEIARHNAVVATMPPFWRDKYWALNALDRTTHRKSVFIREMKDVSRKYPPMSGEQIQTFLRCFGSYAPDAYPVLMRVMKEVP